ncbi:MAG: UDP-N-acetylglucosamine 2-epimerase (non-hydrolyzing) [Deltaproteobacteria bacterium]|nr:UDP-N-acetylglucosamine 2-epimerase (non-hydrolyzing) [Deltaproteobacteria bacterium]
MKTIHLVSAARPNFMKIAPLYHALSRQDWAHPVIVHTGQHYDKNMFADFFKDLGLPGPHINLGVGSGTHAEQTGRVMIAYEKVLMADRPDLVVVAGDVNSTAACALAAVKLGIRVAHLEAGLRSFDRTMPEEINRVVTDSIADYLWTPSRDGNENLLREGIASEKITMVGNIMIDSLVMMTPAIRAEQERERIGLESGLYGVVTLHRPSNVDDRGTLYELCKALGRIAEKTPLVFPVHPRTHNQLERFGLLHLLADSKGIILTEPMGYKAFMNLVFGCRFAITDSGGLQEETTYLLIPCVTLRSNTERPVTVTQGTNILGTPRTLEKDLEEVMGRKVDGAPEFWDGNTAQRVVKAIKSISV